MTIRNTPVRRARLLLVVSTAFAAFGAAFTAGAADKPQKTPDASAMHYERPTDPSLYVGAETCKTCHEDIYKNFETTPIS